MSDEAEFPVIGNEDDYDKLKKEVNMAKKKKKAKKKNKKKKKSKR